MYVFSEWLYIAWMCSYCNMVRWTWWDWSLSLGPLLPSVLWHCWLGHSTRKNPSPIWTMSGTLNPTQSIKAYNVLWKVSLAWHQNCIKTRMWANAQRDSYPAEYRWRPLFNAAKFGWRPLPKYHTRWNLLGWTKLANRSQPLVGRRSAYCGDICLRYCCLTSFSDCRYVP